MSRRIPASLTKAYNRAIKRQGDAAEKSVKAALEEYMRENPDSSVEEIREFAIEIMQAAADLYGNACSQAALELQDEIAIEFGTKPPDIGSWLYEPDEESISRTAHYQAGKLVEGDKAGFVKEIADAARYYAERGANSTMAQTARKQASGKGGKSKRKGARTHGVLFARVPSGATTCPFCLMLASRGFVYLSKESAGELDQFHRHCDCRIVPGYPGMELEGYDPDYYYDLWKASEQIEGMSHDDGTPLSRSEKTALLDQASRVGDVKAYMNGVRNNVTQAVKAVQGKPVSPYGDMYGADYPPEELKKLREMYAKAPDDVKKLYARYGGGLQPVDQTGVGQGDAFFYTGDGHVHILAADDIAGDSVYRPLKTGMHEYGHNIDWLAGNGTQAYGGNGGYLSNAYRDKDGRRFGEIIMRDCEDAVREHAGKPRLGEATVRHIMDNELAKQAGQGGMGMDWCANDVLREWRAANGVARSDPRAQAMRTELSQARTKDDYLAFFDRHESELGDTVKALHERAYYRDTKPTVTEFNAFASHIESHYSKHECADLSDMFNKYSIDNGFGEKPFYFVGHDANYYIDPYDQLENESFAAITSEEVGDEQARRAVEKYLPNAYNAYHEMIREAVSR